MRKFQFFISCPWILLLFCCTSSVMSLWEFAISTEHQINFYDDQWSLLSSIHEFENPSALAFDETEENIYFNDLKSKNFSIFSLKAKLGDITDGSTRIQSVKSTVKRRKNETINAIAYDPLDRLLYWTDSENRKIYSMSVDGDSNVEPTTVIDFSKENSSYPDGIAIDICDRKIYWTNSNSRDATVERSSLTGTERQIIQDEHLYFPHGIFIDQFSKRVFWVVDQHGSHYSVESAKLDGTDRVIHVHQLNNQPQHLTVTRESIYWTDLIHDAVWNISKTINATGGVQQPQKVLRLKTPPTGIISRQDYLTHLENDQSCSDAMKTIKNRLTQAQTATTPAEIRAERKMKNIFCLNNGDYNPVAGKCICKVGFRGVRCETHECHNYCLHGTCTILPMGKANCDCQEGFTGERCDAYKCNDYCMNGGTCAIIDNTPKCSCLNSFTGDRCEKNSTEICQLLCKLKKFDGNIELPFACSSFCEFSDYKTTTISATTYDSLLSISPMSSKYERNGEICSNTYNKTLIFVMLGVIIALILVFLIVIVMRKAYKPLRPRIKKTFVVHKKVSQTPMTSRPVATEQCEITIENCCNMNICDTPCFDPNLLKQNMSFDNCAKDDKKMLINHEEDLY